jgi:membrane-associated phospholipid phosphatase
VALVTPASSAWAQGDSTPPPPVVTRADLGWLALAGGLAALAQRTDLTVRNEVQRAGAQGSDALGLLADGANFWGQPGVVITGAALWGGGLLARHETSAAVGLRAIEAITVSGVVTKLLKGTFGRARPRVSPTDAWDVELGRGFGGPDSDYEALPSGHSTAAFAFASAVTHEVARRAPEHARTVAVASYAMAAATAYARLHRDAHWLSDVTLGAGIGIVSGTVVTRWHAARPGNRVDGLLLRPVLAPAPRSAFAAALPVEMPRATMIGLSLAWR